MSVRWTTAFLDLPADVAGVATDFWLAATSTTLSNRRGVRDEFATLVPADGDAFLRVQILEDGPGGCHLDLHVDDVPGMTARAVALGASVVAEQDTLAALRSPGGLGLWAVRDGGETVRPAPVRWPSGQRSLVDQVCLDIAPEGYDVEAAFWAELTEWERRAGARPEFDYLVRADGIPLRLLLQRLDDSRQPACGAHLDLACDDVGAEVRRHLVLGASLLRRTADWVTLRDPAGLAYCITRRDPGSGRLA